MDEEYALFDLGLENEVGDGGKDSERRDESSVKTVFGKRYCDVCKQHVTLVYWDQHVKTIKHLAGPKRGHTCIQCGSIHSSTEALRVHKTRKHNATIKKTWLYKCTACQKRIRDHYSIDFHLISRHHFVTIYRKFPEYLIRGTDEIDPKKARKMIIKDKIVLEEWNEDTTTNEI